MPPAQCGVCVISVDLGISGAGRANADRSIAAAAADALARMNRADWPATWSLGPAVACEELAAALDEQPHHERAILAGDDWYSVDNHRGCFSQQLSERLSQAQAAGCHPTTLALPAGHLAEHLDLLVKHGISAVRTTRAGESGGWRNWRRWFRPASACSPQPQSLRWGLWEFDGSLSLVRRGLRGVLQAVTAAAAAGALAHVVVELGPLSSQGASGWKQLDRLLAHTAALRDRQAIQPLTVAGVVASLSRTRHGAAARSILRPAA